jgi:hypothetical protein
MRLFLRLALAALALSCCGVAVAAPYPTVDELRAAIEVAAQVTGSDGLTMNMEDARHAGVTLPLMAAGLNLTSGVCQIYYNPAPEANLARFFESVSPKDLPIWLSAIAVHEATHCVEQREAYIRRHFDKVLPPDLDRTGMTLQGYVGVVKSGAVETWGEALADIASVLYLQRAAPDQWRNFARSIMAMRHALAVKWPSHDTSPWLQKLMAAQENPPSQLNCFEAAFGLRRAFSAQLNVRRAVQSGPAAAPVAAVSLTAPQ